MNLSGGSLASSIQPCRQLLELVGDRAMRASTSFLVILRPLAAQAAANPSKIASRTFSSGSQSALLFQKLERFFRVHGGEHGDGRGSGIGFLVEQQFAARGTTTSPDLAQSSGGRIAGRLRLVRQKRPERIGNQAKPSTAPPD